MLGIKMLPIAVLLAALASTAHSPASAATIFVAMNVASGTIPPGAITTGSPPVASPANARAPQPNDPVPMMWAMLTGSFALIGTVVRRKNRTPSVTA